jgi:hypothetical protein
VKAPHSGEQSRRNRRARLTGIGRLRALIIMEMGGLSTGAATVPEQMYFSALVDKIASKRQRIAHERQTNLGGGTQGDGRISDHPLSR